MNHQSPKMGSSIVYLRLRPGLSEKLIRRGALYTIGGRARQDEEGKYAVQIKKLHLINPEDLEEGESLPISL